MEFIFQSYPNLKHQGILYPLPFELDKLIELVFYDIIRKLHQSASAYNAVNGNLFASSDKPSSDRMDRVVVGV